MREKLQETNLVCHVSSDNPSLVLLLLCFFLLHLTLLLSNIICKAVNKRIIHVRLFYRLHKNKEVMGI